MFLTSFLEGSTSGVSTVNSVQALGLHQLRELKAENLRLFTEIIDLQKSYQVFNSLMLLK